MFFLGISAHLFIYLLVPAFLIVCFYFRGISGSPEVSPILQETIAYEQNQLRRDEKTYVYQIIERKEAVQPSGTIDFPKVSECISISFHAEPYLSPFISCKALRAPPVFC